MSDLISRKALMEHIIREYRQWEEDYDAEQILNDIEDFHTAFDVDKVIEELEKEKEDYRGDSDVQRGVYLGLSDAIGVIRKHILDTAEPPKTD